MLNAVQKGVLSLLSEATSAFGLLPHLRLLMTCPTERFFVPYKKII